MVPLPRRRGPRARWGYADTPRWILLVQSGTGGLAGLGILAGLWMGLRSFGRWLSRRP